MECTLYLAEGCNFQCTYCYEGIYKNRTEMSVNTLKKALEFIVTQNYPGDRIDLVFLGGEPLLNKRCLYKAIDIIKEDYSSIEYLFHYSITTNGTLIDERLAFFLKENGFQISVSIDGDRATQNLNRHSFGADAYRTILSNIKMLQRIDADICARMTVTTNNIEYLSKNVQYLLSLGMNKIHIGLDMLATWEESALRMLDRQLDYVDEIYLNQIEPTEHGLIDIYDYKISTFVFKRKPLFCSAGTENHLVIKSSGKIFPCGYVGAEPEWKLGTLWDFNKNAYLKPVRNHVKKEASCRNCSIAFTCCGSKCGYLNFIKTGYLNQHHEETCAIQRILFVHDLKIMESLYQRKSPRLMQCLQIAMSEKLELSDIIKAIMKKDEVAYV